MWGKCMVPSARRKLYEDKSWKKIIRKVGLKFLEEKGNKWVIREINYTLIL